MCIRDSNNYILKNGRMQKFTLGEHRGMLLTSKHENSIAYDTNQMCIRDSAETVKRRAEKRKIHASGVALHRIPFSPLAVLPAGVRKDQVVHIVEIPPIPIHHTAPSFLSEDYRIQYSRVGSRLQGQEYTVYIKFLQSFCAGFFSQ